MPSNILIIGATGVIGKPITHQIVSAKSTFGRIAILTSNNTANNKADEVRALKGQGVEVLVGDLQVEDDVKRAYEGESMSRNCDQSCSDSS
jgi:saccharopine dehydrogenase-like NADP-dependent oxidoreductase